MLELLQAPSVQDLFKMALAIVVGGAVGFERELRGRAAGLRTMILVCLGSTLAMIVSGQLSSVRYEVDSSMVDPSRIPAGIVTGIGFLGAGVVIKIGDVVRGVTTAAAIWFVAALGIAVGNGHHVLAISATALAVGVLTLLKYPENVLKGHIYRVIELQVHGAHARAAIDSARAMLAVPQTKILDIWSERSVAEDRYLIRIHLRTTQASDAHAIVEQLSRLEGTERVAWRGPTND